MQIRNAIPGDEEVIVQVGRESFSWAFGHLFTADIVARYLDDTYSIGKIRDSFSKPGNVYFVAEVEGQVVGFLKLKLSCRHNLVASSHQLQLQKIYVLPGAAGSGIGSELMRAGEETIRALAPVSTWLMVYEGNHRAAAFYERFGYSAIGKDMHDFEGIRVTFTVMTKDYGGDEPASI